MEFLKYPTLLLGLLLFILLHVASAIVRGRLSRLLNYVNLALHIIFLIPMMTLGLTIEDAVLMYMISVFVYTLSQALVYRRRGAPRDSAEKADSIPLEDDTLEGQMRKREAMGITADASPIRNATPVKYDFEPVRIQTEPTAPVSDATDKEAPVDKEAPANKETPADKEASADKTDGADGQTAPEGKTGGEGK
ncbi:MAG: hypothetical protein IJF38_02800 [Clostridia bacterium]|nr:hypothetical protein [Clostridia bacterium]